MIRNKIDDDKITRIIKEPMNPYPEWIYRFFDAPWSEGSWIIDSDPDHPKGKQPILF